MNAGQQDSLLTLVRLGHGGPWREQPGRGVAEGPAIDPAEGWPGLRHALDGVVTPFVALFPVDAEPDWRACGVLAAAASRAAAGVALAPALFTAAGIVGPSPVAAALCAQTRVASLSEEPDLAALAGSGGALFATGNLRDAAAGMTGAFDGPQWAALCLRLMDAADRILISGMALYRRPEAGDGPLPDSVPEVAGNRVANARRASQTIAISRPAEGLSPDRLAAGLCCAFDPAAATPDMLAQLEPLSDFALDWFPTHGFAVLHLLLQGDSASAARVAAAPGRAAAILGESEPALAALIAARDDEITRQRGLAQRFADMEEQWYAAQAESQYRGERLQQARDALAELTETMERIRDAQARS